MAALPSGWELRHSQTHKKDYYFNTATGQTQWDRPAAGESVCVYHLLAKHAGSRRPSSWRQEVITRSEEEARASIRKYREQVLASESPVEEFKRLAAQYSDCSSAKKNGDLGPFSRGQMQKPFEDASYVAPGPALALTCRVGLPCRSGS